MKIKFRLKELKRNKMLVTQIIGVAIGFLIMFLSLIFLNGSNLFYFILAIAFIIGGLPFFVSIVLESRAVREKDEMFLEFSRDLVESVKSGTPISKSILNVRSKDYGALTRYIDKLANQISLGIPVKTAFETFARDVGSRTITRSVGIISESEKAGGQIEDILESVTTSVTQVEKLKKERRAAMYTLVVQGYIIFFIFIAIMLIMKYQILPITSNLGENLGNVEVGGYGGEMGNLIQTKEILTSEELSQPFLWLLIIQGFFTGLVVGKLAEGKIVYGLKHSFILIVLALLISSVVEFFI
jgi:archaeal flagellar protein FlaJ